MESKELDYSRSQDDNNNNEDSEYYLLETSYTTPGPSCCASEDDSDESDYNENFYELIQRMQSLGKNDLPIVLQVPGRIQPKYYEKRCIKSTEVGRLLPVPPTFQKVVITTDPKMSDGYVILTENRASKIFYAIASAVFHTSDSLLASQVKLMFLKQIEKDYCAAKQSKNDKEIRRCVNMVNKTVMEYDEPWFEDEWLIASKAYFAPIHILYSCSRVPSNPHVVRYSFSPVVNDELPIRIVVDNEEYDINKKIS